MSTRPSQRLEELCKQSAALATSNAKALVVIKNAAVQAKLEELGIHFGGSCSYTGPQDSPSYEAGRAVGNRASFGRPVSGRNATLRLK
jgi:hypothetical protein